MGGGRACDWDGKAMGQANDFATKLVLEGSGIVFLLSGVFFVMVG